MKKILIATGNVGKYREILEVLGDLPIQFLSLADLNLKNDVAETGETFAENALLKAKTFFEKTKIPTIGEDSGLSVAALAGELGVKTRRWGAGENATDAEWLDFFLKRMAREKNREATFSCAAAFFDGEKSEIFCGETRGKLADAPQCEIPAGIPVSALFVPDGFSKVFAAMSPAEKNAVSHRGKAIFQLKTFLEKNF